MMTAAMLDIRGPRMTARALRAAWSSPDPTDASRMVHQLRETEPDALPEIMALCGARAPGAGIGALEVSGLFHRNSDPKRLASCLGTIGRLGFSFPKWRFMAITVEGISLLEHAGMTRLRRPSDTSDPSAPTRPALGAGYVREESNWRIEFRRAYIACSAPPGGPGTLVIRNNSHHFGRDALRHPAYLSKPDLPDAALQDLTPAILDNPALFQPWPCVENSSADADAVDRATVLLTAIDAFDTALTQTILEPGQPAFLNLLAFAEHTVATAPRPDRLPWLTLIEEGTPPWSPILPRRLDNALPELRRLAHDSAGTSRFTRAGHATALLSGPTGDLPA